MDNNLENNTFPNDDFENIKENTQVFEASDKTEDPDISPTLSDESSFDVDEMSQNPYKSQVFPSNAPKQECSYEWYGDKVRQSGYVKPVVSTPKAENKPKKKGKGYIAWLLVATIVLSTLFGGGASLAVCLGYSAVKSIFGSEETGVNINRVEVQGEASDVSGDALSTVQIVDSTADSVVEIMTEIVETGVFTQQYIKSGGGSGVIIDESGYIVTNHHVIENASKVTITLRTGESYSAELVGTDEQMDLALLKIDAQNLTSAVFGNSDNLKVGERTVAIGNPLGQLGGSVTEGILSALDRDVVVDGKTMSLLQTDTAINPGNSGGGLFNSQGLLVGIVSAKSTGSEVEGLGFAIPINDVIDVISDLAEYGYVRGRVDLGMEFIDVNSVQMAWMYGLSDMGCYIYDISLNSNAWNSELKTGDLVLKVNDVAIDSSDDIEQIVNDLSVGDSVTFTVRREGLNKTISIVLEEYVPENAISPEDSSGKPVQWGRTN